MLISISILKTNNAVKWSGDHHSGASEEMRDRTMNAEQHNM